MVRGQFNGNSRNDGNFSAALARAAGPMAEATLVCSRAVPDKRGSRQSRGHFSGVAQAQGVDKDRACERHMPRASRETGSQLDEFAGATQLFPKVFLPA